MAEVIVVTEEVTYGASTWLIICRGLAIDGSSNSDPDNCPFGKLDEGGSHRDHRIDSQIESESATPKPEGSLPRNTRRQRTASSELILTG